MSAALLFSFINSVREKGRVGQDKGRKRSTQHEDVMETIRVSCSKDVIQ